MGALEYVIDIFRRLWWMFTLIVIHNDRDEQRSVCVGAAVDS